MKKRFDSSPPVVKTRSRRTEFRKKKLPEPPKFRFFLLRIEIRRKTKTRNPITGTVKAEKEVACQINTSRNEANTSAASKYGFKFCFTNLS